DDGFRNFHTEAFPVLQKHQFTATVFLPTGFIGDAADVPSGQSRVEDNGPAENAEAEGVLVAPLPGSQASPGRGRRSFKGTECLTWEEVRELRNSGIRFGSHTVTH